MFRKAQLKLFAIITSILLAVFIGLLGSINLITKEAMNRQSKYTLEQIAAGIEYNEETSSFYLARPEDFENKKKKNFWKDDTPAFLKETGKTGTHTSETSKASETEVNNHTNPQQDGMQGAVTTEPASDSKSKTTTKAQDDYNSWIWWQWDPNATWPTWDPNLTWPTWDPNATWPTGDPNATWPTGDENGTWPTWDPNATWPTWDPNATWPSWDQNATWPGWDQSQGGWDQGQGGWDQGSQESQSDQGGQSGEGNQFPWLNPWGYVPPASTSEPESGSGDDANIEGQSYDPLEGAEAVALVNKVTTAADGCIVLGDTEAAIPISSSAAPKKNPEPPPNEKKGGSSEPPPDEKKGGSSEPPPDEKNGGSPEADGLPKTLGSIEYFVILANWDGSYIASQNNDELTDETAQKFISAVFDREDNTGMLSYYQFFRSQKNNGILFVFTDRSGELEVLSQLKRITIIIGLVSIIILSVAAYFLSKKSIEPIKTAFDKQKQFISDASHELKTPLTVITTNADVLQDEIGENRWLSYIKSQTERMSVLVNDLLNLTRLENNNTKNFNKLDFDVSKAIENTALPFECQAFDQHKNFIIDVDKDIYVNGSERHIKQMAAIFIDNALKYSNDGGTVKVMLKKQGDKKLFSVYNTGQGVKDEDKEKIFERFYRSDESRNRATGGYGLGLAIAKSIIEKHKFKVNVLNQEGKSICFVVTM